MVHVYTLIWLSQWFKVGYTFFVYVLFLVTLCALALSFSVDYLWRVNADSISLTVRCTTHFEAIQTSICIGLLLDLDTLTVGRIQEYCSMIGLVNTKIIG